MAVDDLVPEAETDVVSREVDLPVPSLDAIRPALDQDSKSIADARTAARELKLPPALTQLAPTEAVKQAQALKVQRAAAGNSILTRYMYDPNYTTVFAADIERLSFIEQHIEATAVGWRLGQYSVDRGRGGELIKDKDVREPVLQQLRNQAGRREQLEFHRARWLSAQVPEAVAEAAAYVIENIKGIDLEGDLEKLRERRDSPLFNLSLDQQIRTNPLGMLLAAYFSESEQVAGGVIIADAIEAGVSLDTVEPIADVAGSAVATLDVVGVGAPLSMLATRVFRKVLKEETIKYSTRAAVGRALGVAALGSVSEGITEGLQTGIELAALEIAKDIDSIESDLTTGQVVDAITESVKFGMMAGAGFGLALSPIALRAELKNARRARATRDAVDKLADNLQQTAAAKTAPDMTADYVADVLVQQGITEVAMPIEAIDALPDETKAALLEKLGLDPERVELARSISGDVQIDAKLFTLHVLQDPEAYTALKDDIRYSPDGMTAREGLEYQTSGLAEELDALAANEDRKGNTSVAEELRRAKERISQRDVERKLKIDASTKDSLHQFYDYDSKTDTYNRAGHVSLALQDMQNKLQEFADKLSGGSVIVRFTNNPRLDGIAFVNDSVHHQVDGPPLLEPRQRLIMVNPEKARDIFATVGHEVLHVLYELNAFTPEERRLLDSVAPTLLDLFDQGQWDNLSHADKLEEAVADALGALASDTNAGPIKKALGIEIAKDPTGIQKVIAKLLEYIKLVREALGINTPERRAKTAAAVAERFTSGEIGQRVSYAEIIEDPDFKQWFEGSKVADSKGRPLLLYHGTMASERFSAFTVESQRASMGGRAFYFASLRANAEFYADRALMGQFLSTSAYKALSPRVARAAVNLKNPLVIKSTKRSALDAHLSLEEGDGKNTPVALARQAYEAGEHDGLVVEGADGEFIVVAFEPEQIRSAASDGKFSVHVPNRPGNPEFDAWFEGSKVVDEDGQPQVMYHGSKSDERFDEFLESERGLWFTTDVVEAQLYGRVAKTYVSIKNPLTVRLAPNDLPAEQFWTPRSDLEQNPVPEGAYFLSPLDAGRALRDMPEEERSQYDGMLIVAEGTDYYIAVAFDPSQVRSTAPDAKFSVFRPRLYSKLENHIKAAPREAMTKAEWMKWLTVSKAAKRSGFSQTEIDDAAAFFGVLGAQAGQPSNREWSDYLGDIPSKGMILEAFESLTPQVEVRTSNITGIAVEQVPDRQMMHWPTREESSAFGSQGYSPSNTGPAEDSDITRQLRYEGFINEKSSVIATIPMVSYQGQELTDETEIERRLYIEVDTTQADDPTDAPTWLLLTEGAPARLYDKDALNLDNHTAVAFHDRPLDNPIPGYTTFTHVLAEGIDDFGVGTSREQARRVITAITELELGEDPVGTESFRTNYEEYVISGDKTNYREVLITNKHGPGNTRYSGGHFEVVNSSGMDVIVHVRLSDRVTPLGDRTLFIDEMQSDQQQGFEKKIRIARARIERSHTERRAVEAEAPQLQHELDRILNSMPDYASQNIESLIELQQRDITSRHATGTRSIPSEIELGQPWTQEILMSAGLYPAGIPAARVRYALNRDQDKYSIKYWYIGDDSIQVNESAELDKGQWDLIASIERAQVAWFKLVRLGPMADEDIYNETILRNEQAISDAEQVLAETGYRGTRSWVRLAQAIILEMAVDGGYDAVAWPSGEALLTVRGLGPQDPDKQEGFKRFYNERLAEVLFDPKGKKGYFDKQGWSGHNGIALENVEVVGETPRTEAERSELIQDRVEFLQDAGSVADYQDLWDDVSQTMPHTTPPHRGWGYRLNEVIREDIKAPVDNDGNPIPETDRAPTTGQPKYSIHVESAEQLLGLNGFADQASDLGMTERDFANYLVKLQRASEAGEKRARKAALNKELAAARGEEKELRDKLIDEVTEEVNLRPEHASVLGLSTGVSYTLKKDGTPYKTEAAAKGVLKKRGLENWLVIEVEGGWGILAPEGRDQRLDREQIQAILDGIGKRGRPLDILPRLDDKRVLYRPNGYDVDVWAGLYGYNDGREMVMAWLKAGQRRAVIKEEVEQRLADDPITQRKADLEAAIEAVYTDDYAEVLAFELNAVRAAKKDKRIKPAQVRAWAKTKMLPMLVSDITPNKLDSKVRKFGKQARKELKAGDREAAVKSKFLQLIYFQMAREAYGVREQARKDKVYLARFNKARRQMPGLPPQYLQAIKTYMHQAGFAKNLDDNARIDLDSFVEYVREIEGVELDLAPIPEGTPTLRDYLRMMNTIRQIEHVGRMQNKLMRQADRESVQERVAAVAAGVQENLTPRTPGERPHVGQRVSDHVASIQLNPYSQVGRLDGFKPQGPVYNALLRPYVLAMTSGYREGQVGFEQRFRDASNELKDLWNLYDKRTQVTLERTIEMPGVRIRMTKGRQLSVLLNLGNDGNRQALLDSGDFTEQELNTIKESADETDWQFVQGVWNLLDSLWPEVRATIERRQGKIPVEVQSRAVVTRYGTYKGGYYPLYYDRDRAIFREDSMDDMLRQAQYGSFTTAHTADGHTKERQDHSGKPVRLDPYVIHAHLKQVLYDLEVGDAVRDIYKVLHHEDTRRAFSDLGHKQAWDDLDLWFRDIVTGEMHFGDVLNKIARHLRAGFVVSKLGFNLRVTGLQILGAFQSAAQIGSYDMVKGATKVLLGPQFGPNSVWSYPNQHSAVMRQREFNFNHDITQAKQQISQSLVRKYTPGESAQTVAHYALFPIVKMQRVVDVMTWYAAQSQGMRRFDGDFAKSVEFADQRVLRTQASGVFGLRSKLERGSFTKDVRQQDWIRALVPFISYFMAKNNIAYERTKGTNFLNPAQVISWSVDMALLFAVEAYIINLLKEWSDDEDEYDDDDLPIAARTAMDAAGTALGGMPFLRDLYVAAQGFPSGGVIGSTMADFGNLAQQVGQLELDWGTVKATLNLIGIVGRVPGTGPAIRTYEASQNDEADLQDWLLGYKK